MHASFNDNKIDYFDESVVPRSRKQSCFFRLLFPLTWIFEHYTPEIIKGFIKPLQLKDIPMLHKKNRNEHHTKKFSCVWNFLRKRISKKSKLRSFILMISLVYTILWKLTWALTLALLSSSLSVCVPFFMEQFLRCLSPVMSPQKILEIQRASEILPSELQPPPYINGFRYNNYEIWIWLCVVIIAKFLALSFYQGCWFTAIEISYRLNGILLSKVFDKSFKLSNKARNEFTNGVIMNITSSDCGKIGWSFEMFINVGSRFFVTMTVSIFFLINLLGVSALFGLCFGLLVVPVGVVFYVIVNKMQKKLVKKKDERIGILSELLKAISIVKLFAWEKPNLKRIEKVRNKEINLNRMVILMRSCVFSLVLITPMLMGLLSFSFYIFFNGSIDHIIIFVGIAYFDNIKIAVQFFPGTFVRFINAVVSTKRVQRFLEADELEEIKVGTINNENTVIEIKNSNFVWEKAFKKTTKKGKKEENKKKKLSKIELEEMKKKEKENYGKLNNINLEIPKGKFTMVCGSVGSGKSSLLNAILGEMKHVNGEMMSSENVKFALVNQTPFIINGSVKQNILFGEEYNEERFNEVIRVCCLEEDLNTFKADEETKIGEKGINISGGQKLRVALARACYRNANVYLLDDCLSAVDAFVGRKIFDECFCKFLKGKTLILVTHQLQYLSLSEYIVFMNEGTIVEQGIFADLMKQNESKFKEMINKSIGADQMNTKSESSDENEDKKKETSTKCNEEDEKKKKLSDKLMKDEERLTGSISFYACWIYARSMGLILISCSLLIYLFYELLLCGNQIFLSQWSSNSLNRMFGTGFNTTYFVNTTNNNNISAYYNPLIHNNTCNNVNIECSTSIVDVFWASSWYRNETIVQEGLSNVSLVLIYCSIVIVISIFNFIREIFFQNLCVSASKKLHSTSLKRVFHAPMQWFDCTPLGRITSRFSGDVDTVDYTLPIFLQMIIDALFNSIGIFCVISVFTSGLFIVVLVPILILYVALYFCHRRSGIESKRIVLICKSPVMSQMSETLGGLSTIRAFKKQKEFLSENSRRINIYLRTALFWRGIYRWMQLRVDYIGILILGSVGILVILLSYYFPILNISTSALVFTVSLIAIQQMDIFVRISSTVEGYFASVERLWYYGKKIPNEALSVVPNKKMGNKWIKRGEIRIEGYKMKYRPNLPLVLKGIDLIVKPGEKVGVCGRTGCGKSSLFLSLLRIIEPTEGKIFIDDVDITTIGLDDLRHAITLIPQCPILFNGSIRSNLDPFEEYSDEEVWNALERSHLKEIVEKRGNGILSVVKDGGENFSQGERQLICLARALLKKSQILLLDECSASVDIKTDQLIQKSIREHCKECTILTIAHRLNTILDSERILVMKDGLIVEYDTPNVLMEKGNEGVFKKLMEQCSSKKKDDKESKTLIIEDTDKKEEINIDKFLYKKDVQNN